MNISLNTVKLLPSCFVCFREKIQRSSLISMTLYFRLLLFVTISNPNYRWL
nr:unnamed protein product [Callosobruchus analis]